MPIMSASKEDDGLGYINGSGGSMTGLGHLGNANVSTNLEAHREDGHLLEVTGLSYVEVMADVHRIERDWETAWSMVARRYRGRVAKTDVSWSLGGMTRQNV